MRPPNKEMHPTARALSSESGPAPKRGWLQKGAGFKKRKVGINLATGDLQRWAKRISVYMPCENTTSTIGENDDRS